MTITIDKAGTRNVTPRRLPWADVSPARARFIVKLCRSGGSIAIHIPAFARKMAGYLPGNYVACEIDTEGQIHVRPINFSEVSPHASQRTTNQPDQPAEQRDKTEP